MKKIAIVAPTGMLGSMIYNMLKNEFSLALIFRDKKSLNILDAAYGGVKQHTQINFDLLHLREDYVTGFKKNKQAVNAQNLFEKIGNVDAVINCAGIINTKVKDADEAVFINGIVPHILSNYYTNKLIHITTDCVFNGTSGAPYTEQSVKSPTDFYGLSKSIGEPSGQSLILRTSIIGPEIIGKTSLLEWVRKQDGKSIDGYVNHLWNGITTKEFAQICRDIVSHREKYPANGLFHIFSSDISKYEMVKKLVEKYKLHILVNPVESFAIDRRLRSVYPLCKELQIPSFDTMLSAL